MLNPRRDYTVETLPPPRGGRAPWSAGRKQPSVKKDVRCIPSPEKPRTVPTDAWEIEAENERLRALEPGRLNFPKAALPPRPKRAPPPPLMAHRRLAERIGWSAEKFVAVEQRLAAEERWRQLAEAIDVKGWERNMQMGQALVDASRARREKQLAEEQEGGESP